jgi:colanic acid biosynthesis glycosyl transferase WcaI
LRKIIFVNRYFFPDHSATSQILSDLAFHLATQNDVHVITSRQKYDDPNANLPARAVVNGVSIHRVWTSKRGRAKLAGRALDYGSFYLAAMAQTARIARRNDIVVAKTDPPLVAAPVAIACRLRRAKLVNWLQDLYPDVAAALGLRLPPGAMGVASWLRNRSLKAASANVVVSEAMAARVTKLGVSANAVVIPNWSDEEAIHPVPPADNTLRSAWNLGGKFVIGYSGNLGRAHEIETVLGAAQQLRAEEDVRFVFTGGGHLLNELERRAQESGLNNIAFHPYQPRDKLSESLSVADLHWLSLRPELEGLVFPSKLYGIAAAGRPVIIVSNMTGELARLVEANGFGFSVEPGDSAGFASLARRLRDDKSLRLEMSAKARATAETRFSRASALQQWEKLLLDLAR